MAPTSVLCRSGSTMAFQIPAFASVTNAICSALALQILGVTLVHRFSISASGSSSTCSAAISRTPGVVSPSSTIAPPSIGSTLGCYHGCGLGLTWLLLLLRFPRSSPPWTLLVILLPGLRSLPKPPPVLFSCQPVAIPLSPSFSSRRGVICHTLELFSFPRMRSDVLEIADDAVGVKTISVMERDPVNLDTGVTEIRGYDLILWKTEGNIVAEVNKGTNLFGPRDLDDLRFSGRLHLHRETGDLTISDSKTTDSGDYHLHMSNSAYTLQRTIRVIVKMKKNIHVIVRVFGMPFM
ncbi:hypothetical protein cypCar_00038985 [Cyprinus carpio]|nr:hypothetical protein cypCar_00038985 [Cyprinus carpio]